MSWEEEINLNLDEQGDIIMEEEISSQPETLEGPVLNLDNSPLNDVDDSSALDVITQPCRVH